MEQNNVSYEAVKNSLASSEAAVEIVRADYYGKPGKDIIYYAGLVVRKNSEGGPSLVLMENGKAMETRFYRFYNNSMRSQLIDEYSYDIFWKQIALAVGNATNIYLSPDGVYNQLNINTFRNSDEKYVLNLTKIIMVSNTKVLPAIKKGANTNPATEAYLLGGPEYGGDGSVPALPGTKKEVENISVILSAKKYKTTNALGSNATEKAIKTGNFKGLLHMATHGYFLEDVPSVSKKVFGVNTERALTNPMLRSGLMFTGAGATAIGEATDDLEGSDNGILTAYEASAIKLDQTRLVVLSACETGLGDVKAGEGVYGLQRSFMIAGAGSIIMSLWKVDDDATQKLMTAFYKGYAAHGDLHSAFADAQRQLMTELPHPFYWGAFVLIGG